jgi:hypothetical protein
MFVSNGGTIQLYAAQKNAGLKDDLLLKINIKKKSF